MNKKIHLSLIAALCVTTLGANEFRPVGFKATGMGGTGVASTRGSLSGYYNPALLRFSDYTTEIGLNVGVRLRESNILDNMDKLNKLKFIDSMEVIADNADGNITKRHKITLNEASTNIKVSQDILKKIGTNNAFVGSVTPSFSAQMSDAFAIGVYANVDVGFRLNMKKDYVNLIFKKDGKYYQYIPENKTYNLANQTSYELSSLEYANNNGINYIQVDSVVLGEVPISYAKAYDWDSGRYSFGVSLKPMTLITASHKEKLGTSDDDADNEDDRFETTYKPALGLDLGFAYIPTNYDLTLGLVAKNINSPKFSVDKQSDEDIKNHYIREDYKIDPSVRAGLSVPIWNNNIEFALDVDLTKNKTTTKDEDSQYIGAGIELHPASWFSWRLGAMQDMAAEKFDDGTIVTTGLGFGLKWLQFDISAMMGTNTSTIDDSDVPKYLAVNFALISRWGDGYNRKQPPVQENIEDQLPSDEEEKARIQEASDKAHAELDNSI